VAPVEFHVCTLPPRDPRSFRKLVLLAESLGFNRFWVSDQTFHADPFVVLADLAERSSIPLGLAVTNPYSRHPAQLARAMASLTLMYPERDWIFGLGTANPQHVLAPLGLQARRGPRHLRVAVETIRKLARGDSVTVSDPELNFTLQDVSLDLEVPASFDLYVGTRGPQVLEHAAGRVGDGVIVEGQPTAAGIQWARNLLDAGSRREGRDRFDRPYVSWQITEVLENGATLSHDVREFATMLMASTADATLERMGVPSEVTQRVKAGSVAAADVPNTELSKLVAAGSGEALKGMVGAAEENGVDAWAALFLGPQEEASQKMEAFSKGVIAQLR
jgi:5,10-methylenetetrahydromethanopterin reductase